MRFSLIPREMRFCDMLDEAADIVNRAAGKFLDMLTKFDHRAEPSTDITKHADPASDRVRRNLEIAEAANELKVEEEKCDLVIERIITSLSVSFITPFDREDIHTLAKTLDDVLDNMEETAHRFVAFRIIRPTPEAITLARYAAECCGHLEKAIHLIRDLKNHEEIHKHLVEISRLENEADNVYRNADAALFANGNGNGNGNGHGTTDFLTLIKLREIYSWLEETVDACKDVANVISEIVIKGS